MSTGGLRVEAHLRCHVASCNGRVELVRARAEPHSLSEGASSVDPQELQDRAEETRRSKEEKLLAFQRGVKERVRRKERARQKQLSETVHRHALEEKRHVSRSCAVSKGSSAVIKREEVAVMVVEPSTAVKRARLSLLAACRPTTHPPPPEPLIPETAVAPSRVPTPVSPPPTACREERSAGRRYTAPSRLVLSQQQNQARQLHCFRRLYSDLERELTRQRRARQVLRGGAERRRTETEVQRRMAEECVEDSVLSEDSSGERERLQEWQETVELERRRHQLQTARETERYVEALRAQLKERLASYPTPLPPLCSCGQHVLDTDPQTCANNCPFYQNPRAYATALRNLLATLKL